MHLDLENLTEAQLKAQLDKYMRLFDVAHGTLLRLSHAQLDADTLRAQLAEAINIIDSYPNNPAFRAMPAEWR